jgi:rifampicin phosphotransferase
MSPFISKIKDLNIEEGHPFGGKASGLARLIKAGACVPDGFAVAASTGIENWIDTQKEKFAGQCKILLKKGSIAIRSSALVEDGAEQSFAGLFETVLDIDNLETAFLAAAKCIDSGNSARVKIYAKSKTALPVGLVVQEMINPRASGVCFSRDPGGKDRAVLIEAVPGIGEALVSGTLNPARWRAYFSGIDNWEIYKEKSGSSEPVLLAEEVEEIASNSRKLAEIFTYPLDLEWAMGQDQKIYWLQARPITTIIEPKTWVIKRAFAEVDDGPVTVWSNWNVRETIPDPIYPLSWCLWKKSILPTVVRDLFGISPGSPLFPHVQPIDLIHGRIYFNINATFATPVIGMLMEKFISKLDKQAGEIIQDLSGKGVLEKRKLPGSKLSLWSGLFFSGIKSCLRLLSVARPVHSLKSLAETGKKISERPDPESMSDEELLHELYLFDSPETSTLRAGLQMEVFAMLIWIIADKCFSPMPDARRLLPAGIKGNPTTEISIAIDSLIENAKPVSSFFKEPILPVNELFLKLKSDENGKKWLIQFKEFLREYGHRGPKEFDICASIWADDPTMVIELISAGLNFPAKENVLSRMERLYREREIAIRKALKKANFWKRPLLGFLARAVELFMPLREAPKHYALLIFLRIRLSILELGKRLLKKKILQNLEDVFFLESAELESLIQGSDRTLKLEELIEERRKSFNDFSQEYAPDFIRSDFVPVMVKILESQEGEEGVFHGTGVSNGKFTGKVKILKNPDPLAIKEGDVIIVKFADPGWTPLFPRAGAVVMEVGGLMCHAAVVARELGIPAVFGVTGAIKEFNDDDLVLVDGINGVVKKIDGAMQ